MDIQDRPKVNLVRPEFVGLTVACMMPSLSPNSCITAKSTLIVMATTWKQHHRDLLSVKPPSFIPLASESWVTSDSLGRPNSTSTIDLASTVLVFSSCHSYQGQRPGWNPVIPRGKTAIKHLLRP